MDPRDAFLERAKHGGIVPVIREVVTDADTPVAAFAKIARPPFAFLLESLVGGERWARYTFLGTEPREAWRYRATPVERWTPGAGWARARGTSASLRSGTAAAGTLDRPPRDDARAGAVVVGGQRSPPRAASGVALPTRGVRARRRAHSGLHRRRRRFSSRALAAADRQR